MNVTQNFILRWVPGLQSSVGRAPGWVQGSPPLQPLAEPSLGLGNGVWGLCQLLAFLLQAFVPGRVHSPACVAGVHGKNCGACPVPLTPHKETFVLGRQRKALSENVGFPAGTSDLGSVLGIHGVWGSPCDPPVSGSSSMKWDDQSRSW